MQIRITAANPTDSMASRLVKSVHNPNRMKKIERTAKVNSVTCALNSLVV